MKTLPKYTLLILAGLLVLMSWWIPSFLWHIVAGDLTMMELDKTHWWAVPFLFTNVALGTGCIFTAGFVASEAADSD